MSFAYRSAASAYASVSLETDVGTVQPARLVVMLYEGALVAIGRARTAMLTRDVAAKTEMIARALRIIDEGLKTSLDLRAGGELAAQLHNLYGYMCRRLVLANAGNDPAGLDEVTRLLTELKDAWSQIDGTAPAAQTALPVAPVYADNVRPLINRLDAR